MQLDDLINSGSIKEAAKYAAESPNGALRTAETIRKFQGLRSTPLYCQAIFEIGKLNALEAAELARLSVEVGQVSEWWWCGG